MSVATLIIIGGFAGAGKTTVAKRLSKEYQYPLIGTDAINDALRKSLKLSFKEVSPAAHEVMWQLARQQLGSGMTVIIDTHMATPHTWQKLDELHKAMPGVLIVPIILRASLETHRKRIELRGRLDKTHLNLGGDAFEDVLFKYEYVKNLVRRDVIWVNADNDSATVYTSVREVLNTMLPGTPKQ